MISPRRLADLWRRQHVAVRDAPIAAALAATAVLPALRGEETQVGNLPGHPFDALSAVALALESAPFALRRIRPGLCLALVALGFTLSELGSRHLVAGTALPLALLNAGTHLALRRRRAAALATAGYALLVAALVALGAPEPPAGYAMFYLLLALAWAAGSLLRRGRIRDAELRRRTAEDSRAAERNRIARELHDVVTHHVTAMVVQAEAARVLTTAPEGLDRALAAIADTGRQAGTDLRHLLGLLDPGDADGAAPGPETGSLRTLVEQTRRAGQPVEFTVEGEPAEPSGSADLVAHRVVQESLTNALKHARGRRTAVRVRHREGEITVRVRTDGARRPADAEPGGGRGLAGLRERVDVLGGEFTAGAEDGGFTVHARIPGGSPP